MPVTSYLTIAVCILILSAPAKAAEIALIIDDIGNKPSDEAAFSLPVEVAFSILPMTGLSQRYSAQASAQQREVMLHVPMESLAGMRLGPGAITADMHEEAIRNTLTQALATVPDAIGVNNHMGSKLTQLSQPMRITMEFLTQRQLFFIDSRTTRYSKAERIARESGVLSTKRNVFIDHSIAPEHIHAQFERLIRLAKKYGYAVGIGHPYPETLNYLNTALKELEQHNVRLVTISDILQSQHIANTVEQVNEPEIALD